MTKTVRAIISGRVQGVFFRDNTRTQALALSISGWVRNNPNGTVELEATGEADNIEKLIEWLHQGPPLARVSGVNVTDIELQSFTDFSIQ